MRSCNEEPVHIRQMARGVYYVHQQEAILYSCNNVADSPPRNSILSNRNSSIMGVPLISPKHQIGTVFLCPALISCLIYFLDFTITLGLVFYHAKSQNWAMLTLTLAIILLPSLIFSIYSLIFFKWDENTLSISLVKWLTMRILQAFFAFLWAIRRYIKRIFWSITALTSKDFFSREECLEELIKPSQIEFYIFLQAFLQATPQAFVQMGFVIFQYDSELEIGTVGICSFITSLLVLSLTLVYFQRFETQRLLGRTEPWLNPSSVPKITNTEPELTAILSTSAIPSTSKPQAPSRYPESIVSSSSDEEYLQPVALPKSHGAAPPLPRPPRPKSIQEVINWQRRINNETVEEDTTDQTLPIPRKRTRVEGLEEDDMIGKFVSFLFWFSFLLSRFFTLILFTYFYYQYVGIVIGLHYTIMIIYQINKSCFKDIYQILTILCVGLIFLIAPIEYKVKFRNYKLFYILYMLLIFCETLCMNLVWYLCADYYGWWYEYLLVTALVSFIISMVCLVHYNTMHKPKKVAYYLD